LKIQHFLALAGLAVPVLACDRPDALETDAQKGSYAVGLDIGNSLMPAKDQLDMRAFQRGIEDVLAGREPPIPEDSLYAALQRFAEQIRMSMQQGDAETAQRNREAGQSYMAQNASRAGVQTTASGLQWEVLEQGTGPRPKSEDMVTVHYRGTLVDGTEFDTSYGGEPMTTSLGPMGVIEGFAEGVQLMPVGSRYRFVIPSELAYGSRGAGGVIGPDATLIFEVELLAIQP
jgi:FKBP-type peptidyl-prolyl cis-trans isomerase